MQDRALREHGSLGRPGQPAAHRRQLRPLHRADGRVPRAHGARARPLHRGLRRQRRPGAARFGEALPHRGLPLQGSAPGQVLDPLPHHRGPGRRAVHGQARDRRRRPGQARHREPDRGAPARCRGRPLPALRRGGRARLGAVAGGRERQAAGVPGFDDLEHPRPGRRCAAPQHLRRRGARAALRAGEGEDRERRAGCAPAVQVLRPHRPGRG